MPGSAWLCSITMMKKIKEIDPISLFLIVSIIVVDCATWWAILTQFRSTPTRIYFLGVSRQSSELVVFPGNIKLLVDAGPDQKILGSLSKAMPQDDTSIDLAVITIADADHFFGYDSVLDHYHIGAFLYNGRNALASEDIPAWQRFLAKIAVLHIPLITVGAGDSIRCGQSTVAFLSPNEDFRRSASLSDAAIVALIKGKSMTALLASEAGANVERIIASKYGALQVDVIQGGPWPDMATPTIATTSNPNKTLEIWRAASGHLSAEML